MFFAEMPTVLLRRWYLVVLGLVVTVMLCLFAVQAIPVRYSAEAGLLLLPPRISVGEGGNPYLALGALGPVGDVLSKTLTDSTAQRELKAAGVTGTYEVGPDTASPAPIVLVTVETTSESAALSSLQLILDRAPLRLLALQRETSVKNNAFITSTVITRSTRAEAVRKPQIRAVMVAAVSGIAMTLMITAAVDAMLLRRRPPEGTEAAMVRPVTRPATPPGDKPLEQSFDIDSEQATFGRESR